MHCSREDDITEAVTEIFLETGREVGVKEIAKHMKCSTSTVYKIFRSIPGGIPVTLDFTTRIGVRGDYYYPTRQHLRHVINKSRVVHRT